MPRRVPIDLKTPAGKKNFYLSPEWRLLRRIKLVHNPICEECKKNDLIEPAVDVHHIVEVADNPLLALSYDNLASLCKSCHSKITASTHLPHKQEFTTVNKKWNFELN
jgi:5-methylcytosine-specific restriction endonuclease McrA